MAKSIKLKRQNSIPKNKDLDRSRAQHEPWQLLTEQELSERERKYEHHLQELKILQGYIEEAIKECNDLKNQQKATDRWSKYLSCDGLPQPQKPQDVHTFLEKLKYYESIEIEKIIDWTLSVDERSVLSQDIFRKDRTRKTLIKEICPNFGKLYEKNVELYLAAIESIDRLLNSDIELASFNLRRSKDIVSQRGTIGEEIQKAFERFTYHIISSQDTYMNTTDGIESNYCYNAKNFNFQIWALRDVPVRFDQMSVPYMIAEMPCVGVQIQIPLSCLFYRLTLRCVHTNFDHYSINAKSFDLIVSKSVDGVIAGIPDIVDCLGREWKMRSNILKEITNQLQDDYSQYEDNVKAFTNKMDLAAKERKSITETKKRKSKIIKPPHEPQLLPEGMYPDVQALFLNREQQQLDNFLNVYCNPDTLNLLPREINLRKYVILGGVFNIAYVRRPKHVEYETFHVTLHEENNKLHVLDNINTVHRNSETDSDENTKIIDEDEISVNRKSQIQSEPLKNEADINLSNFSSDLSYFVITFKLPEHLCFWSKPVMCQYEEKEIEVEQDDELDQLQNLLQQYTTAATEPQNTVKLSTQLEIIEEANLGSPKIPILRRSSSTIAYGPSNLKNIYRPSLAALLRRKTPEAPINASKPVANFYLNKPLAIDEIRALEDFCVPNIISSFKFPIEFKDDMITDAAGKPRKSTKTIFLRKISVESVDEIKSDANVEVNFNYDTQSQPERVYPIFVGHKPIQFSFSNVHHNEPNSMFQLYSTIDNIEEEYISNNRKISCQSQFTEGKREGKYALSIETSMSNLSYLNKRSSLKKFFKKHKSEGSELRLSFLDRSALTDTQTSERLSSSSKFSFTSVPEQTKKRKVKMISKYWTTEHISESILNEDDSTVTVKTDRLGIFGFAYNRYEHFPFRGWSLTPHHKNPQEVVFTLDTRHVRIILNITNKGYTGYVTDLQDKYVAKPVRYIDIKEPIADIQQLKKYFIEKNFNIFAEVDAKFYITNEYFSEKHLATELHIYNAMSVHCFLLSFQNSSWNRLSTRRNMVLSLKNPKETDDNAPITVLVTPEDSTFVEVNELCSDIITVVKLEYTPTWRNIGFYSDLHQLINSLNPQAVDVRNTDSKLIICLQSLLNAIRPLSYS